MPGTHPTTSSESDTTAHRRKGRVDVTAMRVVLGDQVSAHAVPAHGEIALGRGGDIVVPHVNISRRHLAVRTGARVEVSDLGSTNASTLYGSPLEPNTWVPVRSGDVLVLGGEALVVFHDKRNVPTRSRGEEGLEQALAAHLTQYESSGTPFTVIGVQSRASNRWIDVLSSVLLEGDTLVMVSDVRAVAILANRHEEQADAIGHALEDHLGRINANARVRMRHCPRDGTKRGDLVEPPSGESRTHRTTMRPAGPLVRNAAMLKLYALVDEIAPSPANVLVLGETGTGKDVLAHALHERSGRARGPFVGLNCASLPEMLLESELFGYERGAFTGAVTSKPGLLESAEGGSIFLDEIGEMPLATQAKILRVLEERTVHRVGGLKERTIDVRLIAATNRDLQKEIAESRFRADLFYRLNGLSLTIPPLRERQDEIGPFASHFLANAAGILNKPSPRIGPEAMAVLEAYPWPGNIRELRNVVERAVLLCRDRTIAPEHLPPELLGDRRVPAKPTPLTAPPSGPPSGRPTGADFDGLLAHGTGELPRQPDGQKLIDEVEQLERLRIVEALARCNGNQTRAALLLGITRRMLISRIERYNLPRPRGPIS